MLSCCKNFNRPTLIAWFFFIGGFGLNVAMGTWQVERLQWKERLIAQVENANARAPLTALPPDDSDTRALQFNKVTLHGTWLGDTEFHLAPRYFKSVLGYDIITPFKLPDGRIVLVNRGWVPSAKKMPETRPETKVHGKATVTGLIRVGTERNPFTPVSQPTRNVWFGRDIADMANFAHLDRVSMMMVDETGIQEANTLPIPSNGEIKLRNDHLSYIITWYSVALGILIIFVTYHHKKKPVA